MDYCFECSGIAHMFCADCKRLFYCSDECFKKLKPEHDKLCGNYKVIPTSMVQNSAYLKQKIIYNKSNEILKMLNLKNAKGIVVLMRNVCEILERNINKILILTKSWLQHNKLIQAEKLYDICVPGESFLLVTVMCSRGKLRKMRIGCILFQRMSDRRLVAT